MADTQTPFVWGAGGEALTPGQLAARRRVADAMVAQGSDYSPVRSPWQGVARVAQALVGGHRSGEVDRAEAASAQADASLRSGIADYLSGQTGASAAPAGQPLDISPGATRMASADPGLPMPAARAPVAPTAKVWGDKEAEDAGIYEPAVKPAVAAPAVVSPAVATVAAAMPRTAMPAAAPGINPAVLAAATSPYASDGTRSLGMQLLSAAMKPKEKFVQETDAAGNIWNVDTLSGKKTVEFKAEKPEEVGRPITAEERKSFGIPDGVAVMMTSRGPKAIGSAGSSVTVNNGGGTDKQIFDEFAERSKDARLAAGGFSAIQNARAALNGPAGVITGQGADTRLAFEKIGAQLGFNDPDRISNTEAFRAAIAPQVASVLRSTVGSANISDSDRRFAEKASGGSIELDKTSINRLLDIMERGNHAILKQHQDRLDKVYPDEVKHTRERALFTVPVPAQAAPVVTAGKTKSGIGFQIEPD